MSFTNFSAGGSHSFGGTYTELTPYETIRRTDRFDDPALPGEMQVTIRLQETLVGTDLSIAQEGLPAAVPVEFALLGWQESLAALALLVEPEIPAGT
jgi:uncharacterized protein YndB with AHSA1/START domain